MVARNGVAGRVTGSGVDMEMGRQGRDLSTHGSAGAVFVQTTLYSIQTIFIFRSICIKASTLKPRLDLPSGMGNLPLAPCQM